MSSIGLPEPVPMSAGPLTTTLVSLSSGLLALAYLLAGVGLAGPLVRRLVCVDEGGHRVYVQVGLGIGLMLWLSHALGCLGLLSGVKGQLVAIGVSVAGLAMLTVQCARAFAARARLPSVPPVFVLCAPAVGVLLTAAANPPGSMWISEARGYDALSYHLPLAMEWTAGARLEPLVHNVYSFLPSYVEAGFMHLDAALGGGAGERMNGGLMAGAGFGVLACQWLHAWCALAAGVITARAVLAIARRAGCGAGAARFGAAVSGAVMIGTPWAVVTGSLAYNECAVNVMSATALLTCAIPGLSARARGVLVGGALGLAAGCKPTALFMAGPTVIMLLLGCAPARTWWRAAVWAVITGTIALGPPLVRNWAHSGNPVFPAGSAVFGTAHWTQEQVDRFARAHKPGMSAADALHQFVSTTANSATVDSEPRGAMHRQWGVLLPGALLFAAACACARATLGLACVFVAGAALSVLWWATGSNVQSRFLLPLLVNGAALVGLGAAAWSVRAPQRTRPSALGWVIGAAACAVVIAQVVQTVRVFARENPGPRGRSYPNALLVGGPEMMSGMLLADEYARSDSAGRAAMLDEQHDRAWVNLGLRPDDVVLLVGDACPTYLVRRTVYVTTWDRSLLAAAMLRAPDDPGAWAGDLRRAGVTHVLLSPSELERLGASGWLDPALTPERVSRFLSTQCEIERGAEGGGPRLYRLRHGGPGGRGGEAARTGGRVRSTTGAAA